MQRIADVFRAVTRLAWLAWELSAAAGRCWSAGFRPGAFRAGSETSAPATAPVESEWLHHTAARVLRVLSMEPKVIGPVPARGLLVANHLSYLDIIVLASLTPCVFVAKSEVKSWPVFGWFARRGGTVFVNRASRRDAVRATEEIRAALDAGALVVLFPEGTSSDGAKVRPFKSSLLEAAVGVSVPVSVAALRYELSDGDAAQDVCYWGKHTLVPHLFKLLSKRRVRAAISFAPIGNTWRDRKKLAAQLHAEVSALHAGLQGGTARAASRGTAQSGEGQGREACPPPSFRPPGADGMLSARAFPPSRLFDTANPNA